jgi:hypothetical protein
MRPALLRGITDGISVLTRESAADGTRRRDPIWLRGIKYTFATALAHTPNSYNAGGVWARNG